MSSIKSCLITRGFCDLEYPTGKARLNAWSVSFFVTLLGVMVGVGLLVHAAMTNGGKIDFTSLQSKIGIWTTSLSTSGFAIVMIKFCCLPGVVTPVLPRGVALPPGYRWYGELNGFYPEGTQSRIGEDGRRVITIPQHEKKRAEAFMEQFLKKKA